MHKPLLTIAAGAFLIAGRSATDSDTGPSATSGRVRDPQMG